MQYIGTKIHNYFFLNSLYYKYSITKEISWSLQIRYREFSLYIKLGFLKHLNEYNFQIDSLLIINKII